jgi:YidC/Oxa1 family membrane protein insertase
MYEFLRPLEAVVSYIFYYIHAALNFIGVKSGAEGPAWIFSIIFLTIVIRLCILPLFIKSIHSSRGMQAIQPKMKAIQKKYKGKKDQASKEALSRETMALYKEEGVNPMGSCLPILIQAPFFISLFGMLQMIQKIAVGDADPVGMISQQVAQQIESTSFFGIRLSDNFQTVDTTAGHIVIGLMIAIMCTTMFLSQKQVTQKNMPIASKEGQMYQSQKMMMYFMPVMYIFSGAVFPVGVLIYWLTTNLWTLGQGLFQLEFMPTPGSEAHEKKLAKDLKKEAALKEKIREEDPEQFEEKYQTPDERKQQREQPKKKKKKK